MEARQLVLAEFKPLQVPTVPQHGQVFGCGVVQLEGEKRWGHSVSHFPKIHIATTNLHM
jgi:hypothetical protein